MKSVDEASWPLPRTAWYVLGVLTFAYIVSFVDRQIFSLLIEPIRADLRISDTQASLLGGFAFAILYTFAGIPIAWLADHRSRRAIIATGAAVWTAMTALCGVSKTFGQLFLARVGVGIGEAALTPAAFSLIGDYFPPKKLGRAMGVYMAAVSLGSGAALIVGGTVLLLTEGLPQIHLPVFGALKPWQLAFICVATPGLLVVALMATVKEPIRRGVKALQQGVGASGGAAAKSPRAAVHYVRDRSRAYLPIFVGFLLLALVKNAIVIWTPTMYMRTYGWSAKEIAYLYGAMLLTLGPLGAFTGGWIADRLRRRGHGDAPIRMLAIIGVITAPVIGLMPLMPTAHASLVLLAGFTFLFSLSAPLGPMALQLVTPNQLRAQVAAFSAFLNNLLGVGLGPVFVALLTDYVFRNDQALRYSMAIVAILFTVLGTAIFWLGIKPYKVEEEKLWAASSTAG